MPPSAGQDGVDYEKETQHTTTSPVVKIDDNANMDDVSTDATDFATGWRLVAIASALVMSIFLVWLPHLCHLVIRREGY